MERTQVLDAMGQLKLYGMRTAYDEIITTAVKRQHEPQQIIGDLLHAEITEKQASSVKHQMTIAKLPLAKEINEFDCEAAEVNETLIRDLATGDFLDHQRNLVLIGGTGTGKTPLNHRHHQPGVWRMAQRLWQCQNDHRASRPPYPSLRDRGNRQRKLALGNQSVTPDGTPLARHRCAR